MKFIKYSLPPFLIILYRKVVKKKPKKSMWSGNFITWQDAKANCTGYESEQIVEKCKNALLKVKNGEAIYERDSVLFNKIEYSWGVVAGLLKAALENNHKLNVLDFGGSLGSSYFQNKKILEDIKELKWNVIEQSNFVDCGKENFENEQLKFYYTIEESLLYNQPNILLLSSVLQYLENPYQWLCQFNNLKIEYIIIDRTAFIESKEDILTIQNVPEYIYNASYPAYFFNKENIINQLTNYYLISEITNNFTKDIIINHKKASWSGMILKLIQ